MAAVLATAAFLGGGAAYVAQSRVEDPLPLVAEIESVKMSLLTGTHRVREGSERTTEPYHGYGTWVDVFDYAPAYSAGNPPVTADDLSEMAELGVGTVFIQAARLDDRTPDGIEDRWLLAEILITAHDLDMDVVAWYLPRFGEGPDDLDRVKAMAGFEVLGHRFDGVALDIEWTGDGIDHETRSQRLLALSAGAEAALGDDPLGAIVPPPVQIEVVNPDYWPGFPWAEISSSYDVWLPMSYWSFRSDSSGYGDGYAYHEESARRLRHNIDEPEALVHGIGGLGGIDGVDDPIDPPEPLATMEEIERFVQALDDTDSIGGSIYDWSILEPTVRERLAELFSAR